MGTLPKELNIDTPTLKLYIPAGREIDLGEKNTISVARPTRASIDLPSFSVSHISYISFFKSGHTANFMFGKRVSNGAPRETALVHTSRGTLKAELWMSFYDNGAFRRLDLSGTQKLHLKSGATVEANLYMEFSEADALLTVFVKTGSLQVPCANGPGQIVSRIDTRYELNADDSIIRAYFSGSPHWSTENGDHQWESTYAVARECKVMSPTWVTLFPSPATYHNQRILCLRMKFFMT